MPPVDKETPLRAIAKALTSYVTAAQEARRLAAEEHAEQMAKLDRLEGIMLGSDEHAGPDAWIIRFRGFRLRLSGGARPMFVKALLYVLGFDKLYHYLGGP